VLQLKASGPSHRTDWYRPTATAAVSVAKRNEKGGSYFDSEEGGGKLLRNVGTYTIISKVSYPRIILTFH